MNSALTIHGVRSITVMPVQDYTVQGVREYVREVMIEHADGNKTSLVLWADPADPDMLRIVDDEAERRGPRRVQATEGPYGVDLQGLEACMFLKRQAR